VSVLKNIAAVGGVLSCDWRTGGIIKLFDTTLEVKKLRTYFWNKKEERFIRAVDDVDFSIQRGQTLGLIGESGSGKTTIAKSIMGLVQEEPGVISGEIVFCDRNNKEHNLLEGLNVKLEYDDKDDNKVIVFVDKENTAWLKQVEKQMKNIRGKGISMIFQESTAALNPVFKVGTQLVETIKKYHKKDREAAREKAEEWLDKKVGINKPAQRLKQYPGELSGGMRQRVMIALALCSQPSLLIADEPTTGLDATTQAMIINLLEEIKKDTDLSMLFITHDLGVIAKLADQVAVMYGGRMMEYGPKSKVLDKCQTTKHPYTGGLLEAVESMKPIKGEILSPENLPLGCRFYENCDICEEKCKKDEPELDEHEKGHFVRCWRPNEWQS
jgi:oligopeptide/dipeptide ABC transporter ATP-binding protein